MREKYPSICPRSITAAICEFATELGGVSDPQFVEVRPQPFAREQECYLNCFLASELAGGEPVLGFRIWTTNKLMLTAEHHCVLKKNGSLVDITPDPSKVDRIVFVPTGQSPTVENIENILMNGVTGGCKVLVDHPYLHRAGKLLDEASRSLHRRGLVAAATGRELSAADYVDFNNAVAEIERLNDAYYAQRANAVRKQEQKARRRRHKLERVRKRMARARA